MEADFESAKGLVEKVIKGLGLDPAAVRAKDTSELAAWTVQRGSANVLVTVQKREAAYHLRIVAPVITFDPAKKDALFKHLLELNAKGMTSCAFGLVGERVVAVAERPIEDLDQGEVDHTIRHVSAVADTYDDRLVTEFGGKRASDK